jgi:hypothetical protein
MMRIIDNKKIDLTDSEWEMYEEILKSYENQVKNPKDLFADLFETNNYGHIVFLKPPSFKQTSLQIFLFLMAIFEHQNARLMHKKVNDMCNRMDNKMQDLLKLEDELKTGIKENKLKNKSIKQEVDFNPIINAAPIAAVAVSKIVKKQAPKNKKKVKKVAKTKSKLR